MPLIRLHDLMTENGKTVRENKLKLTHTIGLGSIVEEEGGLRLYVVMHVRDCDETPLNYLSHTMQDMHEGRDYSRMTCGYRDKDLTVIKREDMKI